MSAKALLTSLIEDTEFQLKKSVEGLSAELADAKPLATSFSARETMAHLAECYRAAQVELAGEKYQWGTFKPEATEWEALVAETFALRAAAVQDVLGAADEAAAAKLASSFIVGHDYYHVGQLCAIRMAIQPEWNAYSIYNF